MALVVRRSGGGLARIALQHVALQHVSGRWVRQPPPGSDNKSYVRMAANVTTLLGNYNRNGATAMGAGPHVAVYILEQ